MRTIRAFFKALSLTLQGKHLDAPADRYPRLHQWVSEGRTLALNAFKIAEQQGLDRPAREAITLHLDRRDISLETILGAVRHNMIMEYPRLLDARIEHNLTTLYAINMNDQFRVLRLSEVEALPPELRQAVRALSDHLHNIPPSNQP